LGLFPPPSLSSPLLSKQALFSFPSDHGLILFLPKLGQSISSDPGPLLWLSDREPLLSSPELGPTYTSPKCGPWISLNNSGSSLLPSEHEVYLSALLLPSEHDQNPSAPFLLLPSEHEVYLSAPSLLLLLSDAGLLFPFNLGQPLPFPSGHGLSLSYLLPVMSKLGQTDLPPSIRWARGVKFKMK